jgi:hypothetical protein
VLKSKTLSGWLAIAAWLCCVPARAQWLNYPTPGTPRTADGKADLHAPAPRTADGKPDLSGIWNGPGGGTYERNITRDLKPGDIQPWAEALYQQRILELGKDAPRSNCLPNPFPYYQLVDIARFVQTPGLIVILYQGDTNSVHRTIFTDGRGLPQDPNPSWLGYSAGHWDGDTLVVETAGFNDRSWLDLEGHPHSEALHVTERYRRRDFGHMDLEMTIDDPKVFTKSFTLKIPKTLVPDSDILESVCENDHSVPHMLMGTGPKLPEDALAKYAGTFEFASGEKEVITAEGNLLFLQQGSNPLKLALAAISDTMFAVRTNGDSVEFVRDGQGRVKEFYYYGRGGKREATRKE